MVTVKESRIRHARKRDELAYPELGPNHEKNKLQALFAARVENDVKDRIDGWISENGWTKRQATEFAFELAMAIAPHGIVEKKRLSHSLR